MRHMHIEYTVSNQYNQYLRYPYNCIVRPVEKQVYDSGMVIQKYELHSDKWCAVTLISGGIYVARLFLPEGDRASYNLNEHSWEVDYEHLEAPYYLAEYLRENYALYEVFCSSFR